MYFSPRTGLPDLGWFPLKTKETGSGGWTLEILSFPGFLGLASGGQRTLAVSTRVQEPRELPQAHFPLGCLAGRAVNPT